MIMDNRPDDLSHSPGIQRDKRILTLPLIALGLDLLPLLLIFLSSTGVYFPGFFLFVILSPIAGLITGVSALSRGTARIGTAGKIIAIIAVVIPLSFVALIIFFFVGASTGMISLM